MASSDQMALCSLCTSFDIQAFSADSFRWRGYQVEHVRDKSRSGCNFCALLEASFHKIGFEISSYEPPEKVNWTNITTALANDKSR